MKFKIVCSGMVDGEENELEGEQDGIIPVMAFAAGFFHDLLEYVAATPTDLERLTFTIIRVEDETE